MEKKIFKSLSIVGIITIITFNLFSSFFMHKSLLEQQKNSIQTEFSHVLQTINMSKSEQIDVLKQISTDTRITLINIDGSVAFDNQKSNENMENHLYRPEIQSAIKTGSGEDTRLSSTIGKQTYYYAQNLDDNIVLRLAFTSDTLYSIIISSIPLMLIFSVIFGIVLWCISKKITQNIIQPIDVNSENIYDELQPFTRKISDQKKRILTQKNELKQKIDEFNLITENIADGLVVINKSNEIISLNEKAKGIFQNPEKDFMYRNFLELTRSIEIKKAVDLAQTGQNSKIDYQFHQNIYKIHISPIFANAEINGVFMLIIDNTETHETEKIRREFSANVSHELKTPLTSISGYAELIKSGLARPEDIQLFAENIHSETSRLINLIENIINLSQLDEGGSATEFISVSVNDTILNVVSRLTQRAKTSNITITSDLDDIKISAVPQILDEIFYNLIENAIKYNKHDGKVEISAKNIENLAKIEISDTGIGINQQSIERIFERFYRADTSHSNKVRGTGLGLSIVKHATALLGGAISVESSENIGTKFTLTFPV